MRKMLIVLMALLLAAGAFATTISEIQNGTATGDVTVSGIVTAEPYAFGGSKMFIQDGEGAWNGIYVYLGTHIDNLVDEGTIVAEGDSVTISGTVGEYYGMTQLKDVTAITVDQEGVGCPAPTVISAADANLEDYEGCLVRLENVAITNPDAGYGEWDIADATDTVGVDDDGNCPYYFWPEDYDSLISITGVMNYSYDKRKIIPRLAWDIVEGPFSGETKVYTRIQRVQQVRQSDLRKALDDAASDASYFATGDTTDIIALKGVVTMPTGLSYAGDGVKFIISDKHGGPWSAILSYNEDASIYPNLSEGFEIEMSGYVGEYATDPANMTELWLVGDITITNPFGTLPDTSVVTTGELRPPETAEQWGNVIVRIEDALIVDNAPAYEILEIDDGSGPVLVDDDSDSLSDYTAPPPMTPIESITGWIYHHYGSYVDSSTYKLCPLYEEDIILGEGPAMLLFPTREPANIPTSSQSVVASVTVSTLRTIDTAKVFYKVDDGAMTAVDMVEGADNIWSGTIPAQAAGSIVEYYFHVVDDSSDVSQLPTNNADGVYFTYKVLDTDPTIYDIQHTHAESGLSPLHGCSVSFDAFVTMDGALANNFKDDAGKGAISVAQATGPYNGIWVLADPSVLATLNEGDMVTVTGVVDDDHEAYWKWQTNTYVVGTVTLLINEVPLATTPVTLADLEADPEAYEGVLIEISDDSKVESINSYDLTMSDGTYSFLLDDDFVADSILDINYQENAILNGVDTLVEGDSLDNVTGVVMYSYGSMKVEVRQVSDVTILETGGVNVVDMPENFALHQNYPNPFNPITTIRFDLATATNAKLTIYDITGRLVDELVNSNMNAGSYDLRWNAAHLSSGMYLYRIETPEFTATNKLLLLK